MIRACLPELLDSLPPDHPDAVHNRRDLRLINRIMRNREWFERTLPPLMCEGDRALELGAGMGELGRSLNRRGLPVDGLDLWPRPEGWPADREWHCADLRTWDGIERYPVIIGNLIFHQFNDVELAAFGKRLRKARLILACEPARHRRWQVVMRALGPLLGANHVTLHDAAVSVTAGFRGDELPRALGLANGEWYYSCESTALGAIRMVAVRIS